MQLSMKVTGTEAKVLSYLLAKNPYNLYDRKEKSSRVRLVYTSFNDTEAEAVIFVTLDPVELVRNSQNYYDITQYINDREFVVSSLFCTSIRSALGTALNGKPKEEYLEWVNHPFELQLGFGPVTSQLSDQKIKDLFEPIGYSVEIERGQANYSFELKQKSSARFINLKGNATLQMALRHLFILIPVIDNYKHYYIDEREIEKLERYGEGWLEKHPLKEYIVKQSLRFSELINKVKLPLSLNKEELTVDLKGEEQSSEQKVRLNELRYQAIVEKVKSQTWKEQIVDLGSGEGKLSVRLGFISGVKEVLAVEPSETAQLRAIERFEKIKKTETYVKPTPILGSLFYYDERLANKDVMILCEVIEHIDEYRLPNIIRTIFHDYQPKTLIITTPNRDYNVVYNMEEEIRHSDHRFEWTREEFKSRCETWVKDVPYSIEIEGIGQAHEEFGHPTQICTFVRKEEEE